jgi:hypothetical protein
MVVRYESLRIEETSHYKRFHKNEVPLSEVYRIILTTKKKVIGKKILLYESRAFYVLCRDEGDCLKIKNAKRK